MLDAPIRAVRQTARRLIGIAMVRRVRQHPTRADLAQIAAAAGLAQAEKAEEWGPHVPRSTIVGSTPAASGGAND